jgi:hypothetical protein
MRRTAAPERAGSAARGAASLEIDVLAADEHGGIAFDDHRRIAGGVLNPDPRGTAGKFVMLAEILDLRVLLTAVDVEQAVVSATIDNRALRLGNF